MGRRLQWWRIDRRDRQSGLGLRALQRDWRAGQMYARPIVYSLCFFYCSSLIFSELCSWVNLQIRPTVRTVFVPMHDHVMWGQQWRIDMGKRTICSAKRKMFFGMVLFSVQMLTDPAWQETAPQSLRNITKQLLTATTVFLQGRDSMRHPDLFNVVSLNTMSRGTHNTDTHRKSLSVCFKSQTAQMFWASRIIKLPWFPVPYWLDVEECGISWEGWGMFTMS